MDTISIADFQFNWLPFWITTALIVVTLMVAVGVTIASRTSSKWAHDHLFETWAISVFIVLFSATLGYLVFQDSLVNKPALKEYKISQLQDIGYDQVEFVSQKEETPEEFVASKDGEYFRGLLVEVEDSTYQIVETAR